MRNLGEIGLTYKSMNSFDRALGMQRPGEFLQRVSSSYESPEIRNPLEGFSVDRIGFALKVI